MKEGTLGAIYNGEKQVGGLLYWQINTRLPLPSPASSQFTKELDWEAKAQQFWFFEKPTGQCLTKFFCDMTHKKIYYEGEGDLEGSYPLDTMITREIKIKGSKMSLRKEKL